MNKAVFLDRDGVLIRDEGLITKSELMRLLPDVPAALNRLKQAGFKLIVITNQAVVARGLATLADLKVMENELDRLLTQAGGPSIDRTCSCPHHPNATLPEWRLDCDCRKPKPGMLLQAARELDIDLAQSFMVGDRITDVIAGHRAGCQTVLVQTGRHVDAPIETSEPLDRTIIPDLICPNLAEASAWIIAGGRS